MEKPQSTSNAGEHSKGTEDQVQFNLDDFKKDTEDKHQSEGLSDLKGMLIVRPANKWIEAAKDRPIPKMLFSELWHEGELCIMFADTNLGKTILAVQIAVSISTGIPICGFVLEAAKQKVLYFDFELSDKQFEVRYSDGQIDDRYTNHFQFDDNLFRVEINPDEALPEKITFEQYLYQSIERAIKDTEARVLVIDNITYLKNETEKAKDALPLMKHLKALKKRHGLSILALAHTPKRDMCKPISGNDLQGSKMLMNFCDSSFAIGKSAKDKSLRYIIQIKERATEKIYHTENVCVCQVDKPDNFLMFKFIEYGSERDHLKEMTETEKSERDRRILELHNQGKSFRDIADELGISHMTVKRTVDNSKA